MREPLNRKIVAMLIIAVLVVVGVISTDLIKKHIASKKVAAIATLPTLEEILPGDRVVAMDADGDGLFDWEEELHGTDSQNPDSDGDGEIDGTEVRAGRNPVTPDPYATSTPQSGVFYNDVAYVPGSLTETVSTSFISNYTLLKQAGRLDDATLERLSLEVAEEAYRKGLIQNKYIVSDIKTFEGTNEESVRQYGNAFAGIHANYTASILAVDKTREDYIPTLVGLYTSFAEELVHIPTPKALATVHADYSNNIYKTGQALPHLGAIAKDPVRATIVKNQYTIIDAQQPVFLKTIADYFKSNGILFTNDEVGRMWTNL